MLPRIRGQRNGCRQRTGGALVEFAVCLPLMVLLIFASLEGANLLFVRQAVVQAAYEAAKSVAKPDGTVANARLLGEQVLVARNLGQHQITFIPSDAETAPRGTPVTVQVEVNSNSRDILGIGPFRNLVIQAEAVMAKE